MADDLKGKMVCGVDCMPQGANCNGYCVGKVASPPEATDEQVLEGHRRKANDLLLAAEKAFFEYAGACPVGPERMHAFVVYQRVRTATGR